MTPENANSSVSPQERARQVFQDAGGILRAAEARAAGIHPRTLAAMVEAGLLERVSRGIYHLLEAPPIADPDLVVAAVKVPSAVVCLISALAFHEITTQIPHYVDLAIAPGARTPQLAHPPIRVYRFSGPALTEGVEEHEISGVTIRVYSAAKTVADCLPKFRNKIGLDVAVESLRAFARRRDAAFDDLMHFAEIDRVQTIIAPYLEAIL